MSSPLRQLLLPAPRRLALTGDPVTFGRAPRVVSSRNDAGVAVAREWLTRAAGSLQRPGRRVEGAAGSRGPGGSDPGVTLEVSPPDVPEPLGYKLVLDGGGATVLGADPAGLLYGAATLAQLLSVCGATLPGMRVHDWPDFPTRGVMLDVSRDRVPTMDTLRALVDRLAGWKINQLQLYMEHTFAYRGHEQVWQGASPFTAEEIQELDRFCLARHVELVPNQNSFGHMHRWLTHEPYRALAECPDGIEHPFSASREPFGLCPTDPRCLSLLEDLYDQLLPNFTSPRFNVGLDETIDLGQGRSARQCRDQGAERVYLDFLKEVHQRVTDRGRQMMFWGDIILKRPDLIPRLPADAIALVWGYEADHPFDAQLPRFADAGLEFHVCPGTSSWNSLSGRVDNAVANLASAARAGRAAGAGGLLITDWGDNGHLQPLPASFPGFVAGAAFAWNAETADSPAELNLPRLLDLHAFEDTAGVAGALLVALGTAHLSTGVELRNGTILSRLLLSPEAWASARIPARLDAAGLERVLEHIESAVALLARMDIQRADRGLIAAELGWVAAMLSLACRIGVQRLGPGLGRSLRAVPARQRAPLGRGLREHIATYRDLWLQRSRPGGLDDSVHRLTVTGSHLLTG